MANQFIQTVKKSNYVSNKFEPNPCVIFANISQTKFELKPKRVKVAPIY
jgi:hypothetical protein